MSSILTLENITKIYDGKPVLDQLNFELLSGQVMGLLGANGTGKSTLMKIALGLVAADGGSSLLLGEASAELSEHAKDNIGFVPQEAAGFEAFKVEQALTFIGGAYSGWEEDYAADLCKRFYLPRGKKVGALSTGQKQLLAIVLALGHKPKCLILDEPVSALDPVNRREFLTEIINLSIDCGATVLFSTHITSDLERIASHVSFLSYGRIILSGVLDDLKDSVYRVPASTPIPGAMSCIYSGKDYYLVQSQEARQLTGACALNLDDLFVALHGDRSGR